MSASAAAGRWQLEIRTPIGKQTPVVTLAEHDGILTGSASDRHGTVPLKDVTWFDGRITWAQSITRPMKLDLMFDIQLDGDTLSGTSKAGRLPNSRVTGRRIG